MATTELFPSTAVSVTIMAALAAKVLVRVKGSTLMALLSARGQMKDGGHSEMIRYANFD